MRFRFAFAALVCVLISGCSSTEINRGAYIADTSIHSKRIDSRVRFLVMHYTQGDEARSLAWIDLESTYSINTAGSERGYVKYRKRGVSRIAKNMSG